MIDVRNISKYISLLVLVSMSACELNKQTSLSNDVFLSHRLFKKNYKKYVYLVSDNDSLYLLHNPELERQASWDTLTKIKGTLLPVPTNVDPSNYKESYRYLTVPDARVTIFLTQDSSRHVERNSTLEIVESDIQKVHMNRYRNEKFGGKFATFLRNFFYLIIFIASLVALGVIVSYLRY